MIRKLRLVLTVLAILITIAAVRVSQQSWAEKQRAREAHDALRKAAEFLKPDTAGDIRFGKAKPSGTALPAAPTPTTP
jgi:hypothetical protein